MTIQVGSPQTVVLPDAEYVTLPAPTSTTSGTLVDITGLSLNITLSQPGRVLAVMTFSCSSAPPGVGSTGEWTVSINGVDGDANERFLSGTNDRDIGAVTVRSANLPAGTYTVKGRYRRTAGTLSIQTDTAQLSAMVVDV